MSAAVAAAAAAAAAAVADAAEANSPTGSGDESTHHRRWTDDVDHVLDTVDMDLRYIIFNFFNHISSQIMTE